MKKGLIQILPLVPCSALACALLAGRWLRTGSTDFAFLLWNLFLAWLPLLFSLAAVHLKSPQWKLPLLFLWLLFFPNAPYLVSDLMHLRTRVAPLWFDTAMLASFAIAGLLLAVASLRIIKGLVSTRLGTAAAWITVIAVCGLCGFGVYLGRFLRLNSWDAVINPIGLLHITAQRVANPQDHPQTWAVSFVFAALLFAVFIAFELRPSGPSDDPLQTK